MIKIDQSKCIGCGLCVKDCFPNDIELKDGYATPKDIRCINCGHCVAICPRDAVELVDHDMSQVLECDEGAFVLDPDQYLNALKYRRTIRNFTNKEVGVDKIEKIIEAGRYSPTAGNAQNVSYYVIRENLEELKELAIIELNQQADTILNHQGPANIEVYAKIWKGMYTKYYAENKEDSLFFNSGTVILVVSKSVQNGSIAVANMETMVYAQGLGMLYSGFFARAAGYSEKIKQYIGLEGEEIVVACMVIGYPNVTYKRTAPRKKAEVIWK